MLLPRIVMNPSFSQLADVIACVVADVNHILTDVICQVAGGIATCYNKWQVLLPSGRCYCYRLCDNLCFSYITTEYGIENVKLLWQWEKLECKMANFKNHRRFSLRCLKQDVIASQHKDKN